MNVSAIWTRAQCIAVRRARGVTAHDDRVGHIRAYLIDDVLWARALSGARSSAIITGRLGANLARRDAWIERNAWK